ncbi:bifunctional Ribosomal protein L10P/Ribosomal protein L10-like domain superfamily [Babesia duncani]|uniref:Bifunctional Ribosomal protein L10P/Ribosomal protein L10-like domain superfamily n=1 Tax=Babesia duncani TaxID=323732 RepID=A0AAD9PMX5_9APIC|nr:bifunctional Ribosomal protein L10P/Ribosomal protein L10-like domain superfamily [Babesia duncani]
MNAKFCFCIAILKIASLLNTVNAFLVRLKTAPRCIRVNDIPHPFFCGEPREGIGRRFSTTREGKKKTLELLAQWMKNTKAIITLNLNKFSPVERKILQDGFATWIKNSDERGPLMKMKIVKNTLMKIATANTPFDGAYELYKGMNLHLFIFDDAIIPSVMSTLSGMYKSKKSLKKRFSLLGAAYGNTCMHAEDLMALQSIPSREYQIATLVHALEYPARALTTSLSQIPQRLAVVLNEITKTSDK